MSLVATIQTRVEAIAASQNGKVVAEAYRLLQEEAEPCCSYPANAAYFAAVLQDYTWYRQLDSKWKRDHTSDRYGICLAGLKIELERMWPCAKCIRKYNPTGRYKFEGVVLPRREHGSVRRYH